MGNQRDVRSRKRGRSRHSIDPGAGIRALRLSELLREELNSILDGELGDERFDGVVVTFVEMSRDGSRARIWYSMTDNDAARVAAAHDAFGHAAGFFRTRLCDALPLKRFPELSFRHDPSALSEPSTEEMVS
jgi:ribosome-binding factor A